MTTRIRNITIMAIFLLLSGSLLQACDTEPCIAGDWISEAPTNMQFQFRTDGSVWLITGTDSRQVWRYEVDGEDILRLYDGMGRKQEIRFKIEGDSLTFYNPNTDVVVEKYIRGES